jgi:hypothetical protein
MFSGSIASFTNSPLTLADAPAPTDGQVYLTQPGIAQGAGGVPFPFYLPGLAVLGPANGMVCTSPTNLALNVQTWQLAFDEYVQNVAFYVTGPAIGTNVLLATVPNSRSGTNNLQATWTNDTPGAYAVTTIATDNLGGSVASAPVNITVIPVILVNGQYTNTHSFTFLATNTILLTMTNPLPGDYVVYSTDGDPSAFCAVAPHGGASTFAKASPDRLADKGRWRLETYGGRMGTKPRFSDR